MKDLRDGTDFWLEILLKKFALVRMEWIKGTNFRSQYWFPSWPFGYP